MSKVIEALLRAREQDLESRFERGATIVVRRSESVDIGGLPALQMEKEMGGLLQNVAGLLPDSQRGIIQFIGSRKGEGTSTVVRELSLYLATKANKSILLVDADHTHLPQHQALEVDPEISLQRLMSEGGSLDEAICPVKSSRLFLCRLYEETNSNSRSGFMVNNAEVWNKLRKDFDFILIDSSPMGLSDEAFTFCSSADGVILVVEAEKTRATVVSSLKTRVAQSEGKVLGLVFNKQRYYIPEWIYKRL
jgi:Mrp family chromosome partitioning ATPase